MKLPSGPPMTLGNAADAKVRLTVWCKACGRQVEPDPRGDGPAIWRCDQRSPDWCNRLVCSSCGDRAVDMAVTGTEGR